MPLAKNLSSEVCSSIDLKPAEPLQNNKRNPTHRGISPMFPRASKWAINHPGETCRNKFSNGPKQLLFRPLEKKPSYNGRGDWTAASVRQFVTCAHQLPTISAKSIECSNTRAVTVRQPLLDTLRDVNLKTDIADGSRLKSAAYITVFPLLTLLLRLCHCFT